MPPSPSGTANEMPSTGGQAESHLASPRRRSIRSAVSNMHWLESTGPAATSSGERLETSVTSHPAASRPRRELCPRLPRSDDRDVRHDSSTAGRARYAAATSARYASAFPGSMNQS